MDWKTCIQEGNAIKITSNKKRAEFLVSRAEKTLHILEKITLDEDNVPVFHVNYYDSLLEAFRIFDRARLLRHSLLYYGESFDKGVLLESINQIKELCTKMKKIIK